MTSLSISAASVKAGKWPAQYPGCIGSNGRGFKLDSSCIVEDFTGVRKVRKICFDEIQESGGQPIVGTEEVVWLRRIQSKGEAGRSVMYTLSGKGVAFSFHVRHVNARQTGFELTISARDIGQEKWPPGLTGRGPQDCRSIIRDLEGVREVRLVPFHELLASGKQPIVGPGEVALTRRSRRSRNFPSGEGTVRYTWLGDGVRFRMGE